MKIEYENVRGSDFEVGDLVEDNEGNLCFIIYEENSVYGFMIVNVETMEVKNEYIDLHDMLDDCTIVAKAAELKLVVGQLA